VSVGWDPIGTVELDVGRTLTSEVAQTLRLAIIGATAKGNHVVRLRVDRVEDFDRSGLGMLVGLNRLARASDCRLVVVGPPSMLYLVMRRTGLHRVLAVELDARAEAERAPRVNP
jgi:anti-anti-sigma regulatory factor